jgi:hypothetical protein
MNDATQAQQQRARRQLWLLFGVFFAPLALAFILYYSGGWRPPGSTNHGDLIQPPRPLPAVDLRTPSGERLASDVWRGHWSLVYIGDGGCDARCREALTLMRQTRLALGDDMSRVQRIFLARGACCDQGYLSAEHAGLVVATVEDTNGVTLTAAFPDADAGRVYIVDPLGTLMMSYAPEAEPKGPLEDLRKLLKLSRIG